MKFVRVIFWSAVAVGMCAGAVRAAAGPLVENEPPCEIVRDTWGTPHIFAESEADGFFALGYACAEDRLLQMDLMRRRAAGRLAEVFGADVLDSDRASRIAGYPRHCRAAFERLPARFQEFLLAYAAGVNAFAAAEPQAVARRFAPLGILPEPWTPVDCLLAARGILALGSPFNEGAVEEYHGAREAAARASDGAAARRSGMTIDDEVAIVSERELAKDAALYARLKGMARMPGFELRTAPGEGPKMSHAWAVSGRRSTTGKPILESDPQLTLCSPPFFYEFHLAAGAIDARGLGIPGCPGLFIGWNRRIAWGASALGVDSVVTFLDKLAPGGGGYLYEGAVAPFARRLERIDVKGAAPVVQEVLANRHGVVFNSLARAPRAGEALVCYDAQTMDAGTSARAMLEVLTAGGWDEFRRAMEHYYYPGIHVVYADVEGRVGYQTVVHRPLTVRSPRTALEGWTGKDEILGRIPFDDLPRMLDPDAGYVSHANNLPVGSWYPYDLGISTGGTGDTTRSLRLRQLLAGDRKLSPEDFERVIHRDDVNAAVAALLPVARKVVEEDKLEDRGVRRLLASLDGWDLHASSAERFPAARTLENTLTPYRGAGLQDIYGAGGGGVAHLARQVGAQFTESGATPREPAVRAYLVTWLKSAAEGRGRAAADAPRTIAIPYQRTIPHNLPPVEPALDIVSPPLACLDQGTIWSQPGNLYTQIVDLADVDNSRAMIAPGNSEDARSPFRTSGMDVWVRGATRPAPLSRDKILAMAASRTALSPSAYTGPVGPAERTVATAEGTARFVPAIPEVKAADAPRPLPGRKPDDPALESAFRFLLRNERTAAEIDAKIAEVKALVAGKAALELELREALTLGIYLIEEAQAGRLRVPYGTPHCLARFRELRAELEKNERGAKGASGSAGERPGQGPEKPWGRMEEMTPDALEAVLAAAPVAYVPIGTFEHHGWHLPVCFDAIKAHALCERAARATGGVVLPAFYYGTGGGHVGYKWTLILPEAVIVPILEATLDHLARQGFKVVVLLTGHYPREQVDMVHRLAREAQGRHAGVRYRGLAEPEVTTAEPGDASAGDHAAKYETSIALALNPAWVRMDQLKEGHEAARVTLPETPRGAASTHDPAHPLYAIHGQDPRAKASRELGEKLVAEITARLAGLVTEALGGR